MTRPSTPTNNKPLPHIYTPTNTDLSIAMGRTVREAFEVATTAARTEGGAAGSNAPMVSWVLGAGVEVD